MMARSPLRYGWRVLMRAPAAVLAEIAWRWTFGVAFWATLYYGFREYFATVEISRAEYVLMRSLEPMTWMAVSVRVLVAIVSGLHVIGPVIIPALAILWIALAGIGRVATVRALVDCDPHTNWMSTVVLHAFRVVFVFAALAAFFGCGILIDELVGDPAQHFAAAVLLTTIALVLVATLWSVVNWFFSLAAIFTARDGSGFLRSLTEATSFYRQKSDALFSIGFGFGLMRTALVIVATVISLIPIARYGTSHVGFTVLIVVTASLAYFVLADALSLWRLAAYIGLLEPEPEPPVVAAPEPPPEPVSELQSRPPGDRDPILPPDSENAPLSPTAES